MGLFFLKHYIVYAAHRLRIATLDNFSQYFWPKTFHLFGHAGGYVHGRSMGDAKMGNLKLIIYLETF